jgi:acetyl esterase/lipase
MITGRWRRLPRGLRIAAIVAASLLGAVAAGAGGVAWYLNPPVARQDGIVYGHRRGRELTLDVLRPREPNGIGIATIVSGGWRSGPPGSLSVAIVSPLLRHGYTVIAVCHVSQPEATVMETFEDVSRAVRFIRHHAAEYGIDPDRIGVTGGSAGGHLSLLLATRGAPGPGDAPDPVDRETSAVQAVAVFFPVTDLLNLGPSTENPGDGGPPKSFVAAFGPDARKMDAWRVIGREISPIDHINRRMPPVLIVHGDADTLVPLEQSQRFRARAAAEGQVVELVVRHGGAHGWLTMPLDVRRFAAWFDAHLGGSRDGREHPPFGS